MNLKGVRFKNNELGMEIFVYEVEGKELFIGKDIAKLLEYSDESATISKKVNNEYKNKFYVRTIENIEDCQNGNSKIIEFNNNLTMINEFGLYQLVCSSKKEEAVSFQKWIYEDVMPSLRKNGYYLNKDMSSEQYEKLQEELRIRNQQVDNFANMIGGNTRKKQKLETFLKDMFPHIKDGYKQFLNNMVSSGSLDSNYNPTEVFKKINADRHIFTHTTSITYDVDSYLSLTNIGMVEMSKRLYEENGKIKLRKSEDNEVK